jgi:hypothetical protein
MQGTERPPLSRQRIWTPHTENLRTPQARAGGRPPRGESHTPPLTLDKTLRKGRV